MINELNEAQRQRRKLIRRLYALLEELEGRPVRRRPAYGFPFDQLEGAIRRLLAGIEWAVARFVDAVLRKLDEWRRRRKRRRMH